MRRAYLSLALMLGVAATGAGFELHDGDRVVLVGNTLIEREQRAGYWETLLTSQHPKLNLRFRNLGWSGDTVWGHARAGFGSVAEGYRHLITHVVAEKPTVLIVAYGGNESFEGEAGLSRFRDGLKKLLDDLSVTKARIVLVTPPGLEDMGRPLPDPARQNSNLSLYAAAIRAEAQQRKAELVDLHGLNPAPSRRTYNGLHFTDFGYWNTASALLSSPAPSPTLTLNAATGTATATGANVKSDGTQKWRVTLATLPFAAPAGLDGGCLVAVKDLPKGRWSLQIDGKAVATEAAEKWDGGISLRSSADFDQTEMLRQTITAKNELYFHRWRPQNVTYLFGFRKHEQGQNAREIPQFDTLIEAKEQVIAKLRQPTERTWAIVPAR